MFIAHPALCAVAMFVMWCMGYKTSEMLTTGCMSTGTTLAERMLTRYHTVWGENIAHAYEADFQY